jgi:hypothetical protein
MLARKGLVADYFHFDDGSTSFAESFYNRSKKAFRTLPVKGNYFLSLYLLGKYRDDQEVPAYLKKENYDIIKSRIDRIQIHTAEAQSWLDSMPPHSVDCFALSNICDNERKRHSSVRPFQNSQGRSKNYISKPDDTLGTPELEDQIVKDETLSRKIYEMTAPLYMESMAYTVHHRH